MWIYIIIILTVILMITWRDKNWIQINNLNSQILQIIQFVHDSLQVTAVKFTYAHHCRNLIPLFYLYTLISNIMIFSGHNIIGRISVKKTVYINLVHYRTFGPLWSIKARINFKIHPALMLHTDSLIIVITGYPSILYLKIITEDVLSNRYLGRIIIKSVLCLANLHLHTLLLAYQIYRIHIISLGTEFDRYCISCLWFCRCSVIFCSVTEKRLFIKHRTHIQDVLHSFFYICFFMFHFRPVLSVIYHFIILS